MKGLAAAYEDELVGQYFLWLTIFQKPLTSPIEPLNKYWHRSHSLSFQDLSEYNKDAVFVEFDQVRTKLIRINHGINQQEVQLCFLLQASGASSDEWPRIEEEKASQDEPAEGPWGAKQFKHVCYG